MGIDESYFEKLLITLSYKLQNGAGKSYVKVYNNNYIIKVNFDKKIIEYKTRSRNNILVSNNSTSNFSKSENMVILECVDRLLCKGYAPDSIELEHSWGSGHGTSGRLDILVTKDQHPYLMIECKNYGKDFEKERHNMLTTKKVGNEEQPKGQLFSYCIQEKSTKFLCLYTSALIKDEIIYENAIIPIEENWKNFHNQIELYNYWNKSFKKNGIFEDSIKPYQIKCKALCRINLEKLTNEVKIGRAHV